MDTEFQDCMAAMVRKFSGSEEARRATAGEMMQDCNRRDRAAEEKPDHDSYWDGFQVNQINQIFQKYRGFSVAQRLYRLVFFFLFLWFVNKNHRQIQK